MTYFILGTTINGGHFWVDNLYTNERLAEEYGKIVATVAYFGGGSVTVYEVGYNNEVVIKSFEKIDGNPENVLDDDNEDDY